MATLEVESLFTSIPLDETIENCNLFSNNDTVHNFIKEDLKELLQFASYESFFTFDNEYYCQLDGVAMGALLGPILADVSLCHFEKQWLSDCPQHFYSKMYMRYVDDIFVTFNSHEQVKVCKVYKHKTCKYQIYFRT